MKTVVTHNGKFHSDEIFGVAVLQLVYGIEHLEIIRTRDQIQIDKADIVLDVGGVYDPALQRFDHHQVGAPVRENGLPYAAFGLVWREYGENVTGSKEIAEKIEKRLVQAIDAGDNGVSLYTINQHEVAPLELYSFFESFMPPLDSNASVDEAFEKAVTTAREYLERVIDNYHHKALLRIEADRVYQAAADKKVLVFDTMMKRGIFTEYPDVNTIVTPRDLEDTAWSAITVPLDDESFASKVSFPEAWAGLRDEELAAVSGIEGALFCHKNRFMFVSRTKEGAMAAALEAR